MSEPVTMQQLTDWVEKNRHRTWNFDEKNMRKKLTMEIKYLHFTLDTRDMKIFHLSTRGAGIEFDVDFRDEFTGTILESLEKKLDDAR